MKLTMEFSEVAEIIETSALIQFIRKEDVLTLTPPDLDPEDVQNALIQAVNSFAAPRGLPWIDLEVEEETPPDKLLTRIRKVFKP